MKSAYLVTESSLNAEILKRLLPGHVAQETEFVAGKGQYSARSLAATILSERMRPVALVVDADTEDTDSIQERRSTIMSLLSPASSGVPYETFLAVPAVTALLSQESVNAEPVELERLHRLSAEQIQLLQQNPLIQQITHFLTTTVNQAA